MSIADARGRHLTTVAVEERIAEGRTAWAWVDDGAPWLERDEAIALAAPKDERRAIGIVDDDGMATIVGPRDSRRRIAVVVEVVRRGRRLRLDRAPIVVALAARSARAFRHCLHAYDAIAPLAAILDGAHEPRSVSEIEATQARLFASPDLLAAEETSAAVLWPVERTIVDRWLHTGDRVLDVGCGVGREAIALANHGMHVHGVDVCEPALEVARRRACHLDVVFTRAALARLDVPPASFDAVLLASDILAGTPGRAARVDSLRQVRDATRPGGIVAFQADLAAGRLRGLTVEGPRALLRAFGFSVAERGDRWSWRGAPPEKVFRHLYRDDVEVIEEVEEAGLAWEARVGSYCVARRRAHVLQSPTRPSSFASDVASVIRAFPRVEQRRRIDGPQPLVTDLRREGARRPRRDPAGRARLRAAIAFCDRLLPRGSGCYRRVLLEVALDAGAAEEPLHIGLHDKKSGHAWLDTNAPGEVPGATVTI